MQLPATTAPRVVALTAATALVIASAGFGGHYAYRVGIHGGIVLAGLSIVFAVALELAKPLAISAAFQAFSSWAPARGVALGTLGAVAVAYSLTSELALMASSRGELTAERASIAFQVQAARDRYQRAQQELSGLKPTKAIGELEALIAKHPARDCGSQNGIGKWTCLTPSPYAAELGRAKRRAELESILGETRTYQAVAAADPGSAALVVYLSALGITASTETVSTWLNLVPVLALELGSAFAVLLVQAIPPKASVTPLSPQPQTAERRPLTLPSPQHLAPARDRVESQLMSHLRQHGSIASSHRGLAKELGADRNAVGRAIQGLATAGLVVAMASRNGTMLRLTS